MAVWLENIAVASSNQTQAYLICENGASLLLEIKEQKVATIDHSLLSQCLSTVLSRCKQFLLYKIEKALCPPDMGYIVRSPETKYTSLAD
jgi:hypothetical protein